MLTVFKGASAEALAEVEEEKKVRKTDEVFLLISMGSQFDHLIKLALGRLGVFCLVADPATVTAEDVRKLAPIGIIVSGGPASVHSEPPPFDSGIFDLGIPVLGICLGFQMWAKHIGAVVAPAERREFGLHELRITDNSSLFNGCPSSFRVIHSHGDKIDKANSPLFGIASTENAPIAAGKYDKLWGIQFHPEVRDTEYGDRIFENFCFVICCAQDRFPAQNVAQQKITALRDKIGYGNILLALSGGSDSSTAAYLLGETVGKGPCRIRGVYIRGIDRPDDEAYVRRFFAHKGWIELIFVDGTDAFLKALAGHTSMKAKRIAMKGVYRDLLETEIQRYGAQFIVQGTLYTDNVESGIGHATGARRATIKEHHNTGLKFSVPELTPLGDQVKDSGRLIGRSIGVPEELLIRHPFPGPGLVIRIEGEVTKEKLAVARSVDGIYIEELREAGLYDTVWQAGAVVTQSVHTCTKGDDATSGLIVALWAVWSVDGFTAQAAELPYDFLKQVSRRITNEVKEVGAVVYRVSDKPPATIEWG